MVDYWLKASDGELMLPVSCSRDTLVKALGNGLFNIGYDSLIEPRLKESITDSTTLKSDGSCIRGIPYHPLSPGPKVHLHRAGHMHYVVHLDPNGSRNGNFHKAKDGIYRVMEKYAGAFANGRR